MSDEFDKHETQDFSRKLSHLEGVLGAYLPKHVFDSTHQQKVLDRDKHSFSRLKSGKRNAANWELGRLIELFDLGHHGFDYTLFLIPFDVFERGLKSAGVGSYGTTAGERLREKLRARVGPKAEIKILRDSRLSVGGIGYVEDETGPTCLTPRSRVRLDVPLDPRATSPSYLLLLHDFPAERAMECLMPSIYAPGRQVTGASHRLPQPLAPELSFRVGGAPGYRCLYGIQAGFDLAEYIGLAEPENGVTEIYAEQVAQLVDLLENPSDKIRAELFVSFGEYLLK